MKKLPIPALLLLLLSTSACMRSVSLTVLQPAQITLPEHISSVAVVDRSKPASGWLNVLEGMATGEGIGQDRTSRQEAVRGLTEALLRTPRFQVKSTGIELTGSKAGNNLPYPLEWSQVEQLCADYGTNAIVTIESFDSDNFTGTKKQETKRKDKNGKEYTEVSYNAEQRTGVRLGWRLYDPKTKIVVDEYTTNDFLIRSASGASETVAVKGLPNPVDISRIVARTGGFNYGTRIAPVFVQESRSYFASGKGAKDDMKKAARLANSGNWNEAATIWERIVNNNSLPEKTSGKAAYNLAVAAEVAKDLPLALERAEKAWTNFRNSSAKSYIEMLKVRLNNDRKVKGQMNQQKV